MRWVRHVGRDVQHAARTLVRRPALAAVVILSLGVGIGVNTAVFSWIEGVVVRPIAGVRDGGHFFLIEPRTDAGVYAGVSWPEYQDLRDGLRTFDALIAFQMAPLYVGPSGRVERSSGLLVSGNYFTALGLTPALGRFLRPEEAATPGAERVVVISHDFWQTRFGGAATALGQTLRVNGQDLTIVGVSPAGFKGTILALSFDLWLPATLAPVVLNGSTELTDRGSRGYTVTGTLAPPAGVVQAQTEVSDFMRRLAQSYPRTNTALGAEVLPFWRAPRGPQRLLAASLALLQGILLLLLLAVCGNTANLVLARATARHREIAIRMALGAGRGRVACLLLAENLLLAIAGAGVGATFAFWGTSALSAMPPLRVRGIPIVFDTHMSAGGFLFAMVLGLACGMVFGLIPAWQLSRIDPQQALRAGSTTPMRSRLRTAVLGAQVALALVVLVVAGVFLRSFQQTRDDNPGFTREGVWLVGYDLSGRNPTDAAMRTFAATVLARVRTLPGVAAAAMASSVPLDIHGLPSRFFTLEGRARSDGASDQALANTVTPGYFDTMGIPFRRGRDFADLLDAGATPQAVVNEAFVRRYADRAELDGRGIEVRGRRYSIVGVVADSISNAFGEPPTPVIYFSFRDRPSAVGDLHVRAAPGLSAGPIAEVQRLVREIDPDLPLYDVRTLNDHIEANLIFRRIPARLFAVLGPLILLMAAIGIYAVVAYTVTLRTTEIGVRLALGATGRRIVAQLVGEHLAVIAVGGLAGWLVVAAVMVDLLSAPLDPVVFAGVPVLLLLVGTLASWLPARRAMRVDPNTALRQP